MICSTFKPRTEIANRFRAFNCLDSNLGTSISSSLSRRRDELVDATRELRPGGFLKKMSPLDARVGLALGPRHSLLKERVEVA
jgi:hypothetical protein